LSPTHFVIVFAFLGSSAEFGITVPPPRAIVGAAKKRNFATLPNLIELRSPFWNQLRRLVKRKFIN